MKSILLVLSFLYFINIHSQSAYIPGVPNVEKYSIKSSILNETREVLVYVPIEYHEIKDTSTKYPVAFVLDGESQFLNTFSAIDYMSSAAQGNDLMPRSIVIGIPNTNRVRDLTPTQGIMGKDSASIQVTGGGPAFLDFIVNEVIPYLEELYPLSTNRTIIGHSLGGLLVFEALLNRRDFFDNYLAIDPALSFDNESYLNRILDTLRNVDLKEENLFVATAETLPSFVDYKTIESDNSEISKLPQSNKRFTEIADMENWKINYKVKHYPRESHFSVPYKSTYEAMKYFYSYYPFEEIIDYYHPSMKNRSDLVERLALHYENISIKSGHRIVPMEGYINSWAFGLNYFDRSDLALEMFDYNIKLYPQNSTVYSTKGIFLQSLNRNEEAIVLFKKSLEIKEDKDIRNRMESLKKSNK